MLLLSVKLCPFTHMPSLPNVQIFMWQWRAWICQGSGGNSEALWSLTPETTAHLLLSISHSQSRPSTQRAGKLKELFDGKSSEVLVLIFNLNTEFLSYSRFIGKIFYNARFHMSKLAFRKGQIIFLGMFLCLSVQKLSISTKRHTLKISCKLRRL